MLTCSEDTRRDALTGAEGAIGLLVEVAPLAVKGFASLLAQLSPSTVAAGKHLLARECLFDCWRQALEMIARDLGFTDKQASRFAQCLILHCWDEADSRVDVLMRLKPGR